MRSRYLDELSVGRPPFRHPDAACRGVNPSLFFPDKGESSTVRAAKAVCAACPAQAACLQHALQYPDAGIWGGTTERERQRMRSGSALRPIDHGTPRGYHRHRYRGELACELCLRAHADDRAWRQQQAATA